MTVKRRLPTRRRARRVPALQPAIVCGLLVAAACGGKSPRDAPRTDAAAQAGLPDSASRASGPEGSGTVDVASLGIDMGDAHAPVRVVEMSDFGCRFCRQFQLETWPMVRSEFISTGKVRWKFVPFVTGMFAHSTEATESADCAFQQGGAAFDSLTSRIWRDQQAWKRASNAAAMLRDWASQTGLDMGRYDACISDPRTAARIAASNGLANQMGVRGTPTFFILGYPPVPGALPTATFRRLLNEVYQKATSGASKRSPG